MSGGPSRTATPSGTRGSATTTSTVAGPSIRINGPTLRLRAEPDEQTQARRIQWAEDVVDNEGMGKKSSKVCCIYHKPKNAGDSSSDESSSSSDSDSDGEPDLSRAQPAKRRDGQRDHDEHGHCGSDDDHDHDHADGPRKIKGKGKGKARRPSPNAYERVPQYKKDKT
ncbi:hypothetical protein K461DRAFT_288050 [Myriangium duriaei CBS 260.36]|uniref:Type 1 phosphatases regulator n=1 Tax=Myriangium duriaei CBS 260.36 TaxID=1168546 RepID=A0A9P4IT18_9PEZI|nr:hypothetical protein K461DRAFT_288050 [Myriangium duriaei CBS 260.36]